MSEFRVAGKMSLDGAAFFSTLKSAQGAVRGLGTALAGAFSVGAVTSFSKSILDLAGKLNDVSDALKINVEFLQKFVNSSRKSGGSLEGVEKFLFESQKSRQAAVNAPSGKEMAAFKSLGFSESDVAKLNPQEFIEKIIEAFKSGATPQNINALVEIGGRSAKTLVGGFKDGLDEQTAIISEQLVAELDAIGDKFTSIGTTLKSQFAPVLSLVADGFRYFLDSLEQAQAMFGEFFGTIAGNAGAGKGLKEVLAEATDAAFKGQSKTESDQSARDAAEAATKAAIIESKRAEQKASPDFVADAVKAAKFGAEKESEIKRSPIASDSRVSIGGFLGAGGRGSLEQIGQNQLTSLRSIEDWSRKTHDILNRSGGVSVI